LDVGKGQAQEVCDLEAGRLNRASFEVGPVDLPRTRARFRLSGPSIDYWFTSGRTIAGYSGAPAAWARGL